MSSILLFDRVRIPDGREGIVIQGDPPYSAHVTVALQTGGRISILMDLLQPIDTFSANAQLKAELNDSLRSIYRIAEI